MDYTELIKQELRFANRLLGLDKRHWNRRAKLKIRPENEVELALILIQGESHSFLRGVKSSIKENNLRAGGCLLRSLLESTANAFWITQDKTGKRARRYVALIDEFDESLSNIKANKANRIPKDVSNWTTSSAEDRLKAFSPQASLVWDYCSIFIHPSPTYMSLRRGYDKVLNYVLGQANTYTLTTRHIMLDNSSAFDVGEARILNKMALELLNEKTPLNQGVWR